MNQIKKIIIILIILIIAILICIWLINKKITNPNYVGKNQNIEQDISNDFIKTVGLVDDYTTFFSVEKMLNNYIKVVRSSNPNDIYNLLDKEYTLQQNITAENVLDVIKDQLEYNSNVRIRTIYGSENINNAEYYVYCMLEKEHQGIESYLGLYIDKQNLTYSIEIINKEIFEQKIKTTGSELKTKQIEKNQQNKTMFVNATEEERAKKYFKDFLENVLYYPEYAYTLLNEQYKSKVFPTLEDFKQYIETNREDFLSYDISNLKTDDEFETVSEYNQYLINLKRLTLKKFKITDESDGKKYTCIDSNGKYYIFSATYPFNYSIALDNYSIPDNNYIKEYNSSTEAQKVVLNIKKFFMGIDDKNYGYSYSVLSEGFKNNIYPTKNDFVNYAKQNFFEENDIEYVSYEKENGLYIYKIKLTDATGNSQEVKEFNMIIKLNSGTDFEMSFGTN